ncbi:MAG: hypothetical protein GY811_03010 [Myxococcales bacterium]|nr:hypothetical protein [Myxococcales bacterium]
MRHTFVHFLMSLALVTGCASTIGPNGDPSGDPSDPGDPGDPGDPAVSRIAGTYEVASTIDLSDTSAASKVGDTLGPLSQLSTDPFQAILNVPQGTGSADFLDSVPDFLLDLAKGQVNDLIKQQLGDFGNPLSQIGAYA